MFHKGDTVEVFRKSGKWQSAIVVSSGNGEVLVQWGQWKKIVPYPSQFIRPSATPSGSEATDEDENDEMLACDYCGSSDTTLWPCTGCLVTVYCGQQCQAMGWPFHRMYCPQNHIAAASVSPQTTHHHHHHHHTENVDDFLPIAAVAHTTDMTLTELPLYSPVESCGYDGDRSQFNGLRGVIVGTKGSKYQIKFFIRGGITLAISPHHTREAPTESPAYPLGSDIAVGSVRGRHGVVVGYRGTLLLCEFDGKDKGVFPMRPEDCYLLVSPAGSPLRSR